MKNSSLFVLFLCCANSVFAQKVFKNYEKIPAGVVTCLFADPYNVKWLGGEKGIYRLEGDSLKLFTGSHNSLSIKNVSAISQDEEGNIWAGTYGSLIYRISPDGSFTFYDFSDFGRAIITSLFCEPQSGTVWAGTFGKGVFKLEKSGRKDRYDTDNSKIPHNNVFRIKSDPEGNLWIVTAAGLAIMDEKERIKVRLDDYQISDIERFSNNMWLTAADYEGSKMFRSENGRQFDNIPLPDDLNRLRIADFQFDRQGKLWAAAADKIGVSEGGNWTFYSHNEGFTSQSALCLAVDSAGLVWVGTEGKGLFENGREENRKISGKTGTLDDWTGRLLSEEDLRETVNLRINFTRGSSELTADSEEELNKVIRILTDNAGLSVEIAGHTDNVGNAAANWELSVLRARAVKDYLKMKGGISDNRVDTQGYGGSRPVADNGNEQNRKKNRRVEMKLFRTY